MVGRAPSMLPTTGDVIGGKYVLERLLGRGGMGAVYAARHTKLGHAVAIKLMIADGPSEEATSRFVNEARAAANIQNEHVVRVSDVDEENGYAYMVLELLDGEDLAQVLERERRLSPSVAVSYVLQALDGVRQAHAQGIVHRDLKPANLFLARRPDGTAVIKVLDFGVSKAGDSSPTRMAAGVLTATTTMLGSPLYMSPEQLRSSKNVDARTDIWAMGVVLYELITGTLPFAGENFGELLARILERDAPLLRTRVPEAPQGLEAIVARCLQRRPENRYPTVADLERELTPFAVSSPLGRGAAPVISAETAIMMNAPLARSSFPPGPATSPLASPMVAHRAAVKGTAPLGATTPQPNRPPTDAVWQSTGASTSTTVPMHRNTTLLAAGALVLLALIAVGVVGYAASRGKRDVASSDQASQPSAVDEASAAPPPVIEPAVSASAPAPSATLAPTVETSDPTPPATARHRPPSGGPIAGEPAAPRAPEAAKRPPPSKVVPPAPVSSQRTVQQSER